MGRRINNMKLRRVLAYLLTAVMVVALVPGGSSKVKAAESIWQNQDIVHWTNGYPMHKVSEDNSEYHTPIYNDNHISFFELDHEKYPDTYDNYHGALATCSTCHATATTLDTYTHTYLKSTTTCDDCGYHPQYYVTIKYTLADGVTAPAGFVEEEKKGPYDRGATYTAYAKSYEGLRATRTSGYSSDTIHRDRTVEYEYSYSDPCSKGANHERKYVSVSDTEHKYCCTKCDTVWSTSEHDKNGVSNRSLTTCQFACSDCGFKKTFVQHNYETYNITDKDGGKKVMKICKNCGFETTDCEHEWETEEYQEEGGDHVRVCKLCGFEDRHAIDAEGSWINVATEQECRYPCCRRCKQAVIDFNIADHLSEYCHKIMIEPNGTINTHRAYCLRCGYVFSENAPCFDMTDWFHSAADDFDLEEIERICSSYLHENDDGTATITCACGNTETRTISGKVIDRGHVDLDINDYDLFGDKNMGYVDSLTQILNSEEFNEMIKSIQETEALKNELEEKQEKAGIENIEDAQVTAEAQKAKVEVVEEPITTGTGDDKTQTMTVDISKTYQLTFTSGDKSFSMDTGVKMIVNSPTAICIPAPEGFGNVGDIVKVDHTHEGQQYVYYGKITTFPDQNGNDTKVIQWVSENGLSPFVLTVSKTVTDEYLANKIYKGGTVTFKANADDATGTMAPQVIAANTTEALNTNTFKRPGYKYVSWNSEKDGSGAIFYDGAEVRLIGSIILYAQWEACPHQNTEIRNEKVATTDEEGYTGDKYCKDCGKLIESGKAIAILEKQGTGTTGNNDAPATPEAPATKVVGDTVTDASSKAIYVVTSTNPKTVEYKATTVTGKKVKIPDVVVVNGETFKVTSIADGAFKGNKKVTSVSVGVNVTSIGDEVFSGCANLTSVTVPKTITKLGKNVFKGCKKLKTITIKTTKLTAKNVSKNAFKGITNKTVIKVPKKKLKDYKKLFRKKGLSKKVKIKS